MSARHVNAASGALAVILLAYLGPIQSVLWNGDQAPGWAASLPWVDASIIAARAQAPAIPPYDVFGRLVIVAYVLVVAAVSALWPALSISRKARLWLGATIAALMIASTADVVAYWVAGLTKGTLRQAAFWTAEVPALVAATLGLAAVGWVTRHAAGSRVLMLAPILAVIATLSLRYMPHGPLLGMAVAITMSAWLRGQAPADPVWD